MFKHYTNQALREGRKVLGGAGPSIAQVPLTLVWVGSSALDISLTIARSMGSRRKVLLTVVPAFSYVIFTAFS